jgi:hypothetical protein
MRHRVLPALVLVAALQPTPAAAQRRGPTDWIELRSANSTVVVSDAGEAAARELLARIDRVRETISVGLGDLVRDLDEPLLVIAPRDVNGMRELVGDAAKRNRGLLVAASLPAPYSHYLAVRAGARESRRDEILMHEYLHRVTQVNLGDAAAWLDEGLSEFWSTIELHEHGVRVGRELPRHARTLQPQLLIPLRDLMEVSRGRYDLAGGKLALFYAQSWALVHYLVTRSASSKVSYAPATPDLDSLEKDFQSYVRAGRFDAIDLPRVDRAAPIAGEPRVRALGEAEALALRASVAVYGEKPGVGFELAERALRLDRSQPLALEVKGVYFFLTNRPDEARMWLKAAAEHPSATFRAHYYYAVLNMGAPLVAQTHLKKALELKPGFAPALERLRSFAKIHPN